MRIKLASYRYARYAGIVIEQIGLSPDYFAQPPHLGAIRIPLFVPPKYLLAIPPPESCPT